MPEKENYTQRFNELSQDYIKFLLYHVVVVFTIVFTLVNGVRDLEGEAIATKVAQVRTALSICKVDVDSLTHDWLLTNMYFTAPKNNPSDTTNVNDRIAFSAQQIAEARTKAQKLLNDIETEYVNAFSLKLSFLGNTNVDLRVWIFILPLIFLATLIYIFILDFKITIIKGLAGAADTPIGNVDQYPFRFLRICLITIEAFLLLVYIFLLTSFLKNSIGTFISYVYNTYLLLLYYCCIYCYDVARRMSPGDSGFARRSAYVYRIYLRAWDKLSNTLKGIRFRPFLGTGQLLMILTLFLIMTYDSCGDPVKYVSQNAVRGYQLWAPQTLWENEFDKRVGLIFKYLYISTLLFSVAACSWGLYKRRHIRPRWMANLAGLYFFFASAVYSLYFSMFDDFFADDLSYYIGIGLFIYWYITYFRKSDRHGHSFETFGRLIILLAPFVVLAVINCIKTYTFHNGWIYYYTAIWLLAIEYVLLQDQAGYPATAGFPRRCDLPS